MSFYESDYSISPEEFLYSVDDASVDENPIDSSRSISSVSLESYSAEAVHTPVAYQST